MTPRKLSRKELLRQDEFLTTMEQSRKWLQSRRREILIGAAGVAALILVAIGMRYYLATRQGRAWEELQEALTFYHGTVMGQSNPTADPGKSPVSFVSEQEKYQRSLTAMEEVIQRFGRTAPGKLARLYRANSLMHLGRYAEAREEYAAFEQAQGRGFLSGLARMSIAQTHELEGDRTAAAQGYAELAEAATEYAFPAEAALMRLADCRRQLGEREQAVATYQRIVTEFPESAYRFPAEDRLAELGVKVEEPSAGAPPPPGRVQVQ
jgi:tetratricopeptide (TPR) repeat protein